MITLRISHKVDDLTDMLKGIEFSFETEISGETFDGEDEGFQSNGANFAIGLITPLKL